MITKPANSPTTPQRTPHGTRGTSHGTHLSRHAPRTARTPHGTHPARHAPRTARTPHGTHPARHAPRTARTPHGTAPWLCARPRAGLSGARGRLGEGYFVVEGSVVLQFVGEWHCEALQERVLAGQESADRM
ncbi:hypothetical protein GCM10009735_39420 [Actinomadura chokoriensis]